MKKVLENLDTGRLKMIQLFQRTGARFATPSEITERQDKRVWGLRKLGIDLLHAIFAARMGDRYMVVAHNPTVKKAISKEKLTKRGLISLSDYYLQVAHV